MGQDAPAPRPGILSIDPYVPGTSGLPGAGPVIKLSSNETPLGPSPSAVEAAREACGRLHDYPDGSARRLREAIAGRYGLDPDRIVCGAGSDELLSLLAQAYLGVGDEAIHTEHGFLVYRIATLASGGVPVAAPERALTADIEAILSRVTDRTRLVFLANPNNPTGTYLPIDAVRALRAGLPSRVVLVLDAAYAEYVSRNDYEAGLELVATTRNTVMTRTFSKVYGLAGLRIGWAYCPAGIADVLNRIRGPFNVSGVAIAAGAAAISDQEHVTRAAAHNDVWRAWLSDELGRLGLTATSSVGNFLLVQMPGEGPSAAEADAHLQSERILLRRLEAYGLPNCLRMTVGTEQQNRAVIAALEELLARHRPAPASLAEPQ